MMRERTSDSVVSGEIIPAPLAPGRPHVLLTGDANLLALLVKPAAVDTELRFLEVTTGRVLRWTGSDWSQVGLEAEWIARRTVQLERELAELHRRIGIDDPHAAMEAALLDRLAKTNDALALAERERDDYHAQLAQRDRPPAQAPDRPVFAMDTNGHTDECSGWLPGGLCDCAARK